MKPRTLIPLVIGLGVGFFAIKMGLDMVQRAKGEQGAEGSVLVAARPIGVAMRVTEPMLTTKSVPTSLMPPDIFSDAETLVGRVTGMRIAAGVPITGQMLAPPGAEPGLRARIPKGYRAVSVSVNEEAAVAGFLVPGCRVDVSAASGGRDGPSKLILSDLEVGAVGQSLSEVGKDGTTVRVTRSVTLFVRPDQVPILHAHSGRGRIRLALRGDDADGGPEESSWSRILARMAAQSLQQPKPVKRPKRRLVAKSPRHVVEVARGTEVERLVFVERGGVFHDVTQGGVPLPAVQRDEEEPDDTDDRQIREMCE